MSTEVKTEPNNDNIVLKFWKLNKNILGPKFQHDIFIILVGEIQLFAWSINSKDIIYYMPLKLHKNFNLQ